MDPTVVFVYDDGPLADYEEVFPVHQRLDAPACVAVVSDWVGETPGALARLLGRGTGHLDAAHLRELEAAGWEVLSHGVAHRPLDATRTTGRTEAGDRVVPVATDLHSRLAGDTLVFASERGEARGTVERTSHHPRRTALVLADPLDEPVPSGASVRYDEAVVRQELRDSKRALSAHGLNVDNVALPYSRYGEVARKVVPEFYDAVANAAVGGLNVDPSDPYDLRRQYLGRDALTDAQLRRFLETVRGRNGLALLGGHSHRHVDAERVEHAIRLARDLGIRITTLREATDDLA